MIEGAEPLHMPPHFKHPRAVQATVDACRIVAGSAAAAVAVVDQLPVGQHDAALAEHQRLAQL